MFEYEFTMYATTDQDETQPLAVERRTVSGYNEAVKVTRELWEKYRAEDGVRVKITDFGGDTKPRNAHGL